MPTSLNEESLESLIESHLIEENGYLKGNSADYDRALCLDVPHLMAFLEATQAGTVSKLSIGEEGTERDKFLSRISSEVRKRGIIDVLRKGFGHLHVP